MPDRPQQQADPRLLALVAAYQAQTMDLRSRLSAFILRLWRSFPNHNDDALTKYVRDAVPAIDGAQQQMASLTSAFSAHQRQIALGTPFRPVAVDPKKVTGAAVRNGADPTDVNSRPFYALWKELHDQIDLATGEIEAEAVQNALAIGEQRAVSIATTDLQLTKTHTQAQIAQGDRQVSYTRRILEGEESCGLCIVASTQRYRAKDLMPIHPGCDCSEELVYADTDPGRIIDLNALQDVHDRIEKRFGTSSPSAGVLDGVTDSNGVALRYRDILVTHEHGEIGPILAVRGQHFTSLADLP